MTDVSERARKAAERLRFMADQSDMGRKPDPDSALREGAALLDILAGQSVGEGWIPIAAAKPRHRYIGAFRAPLQNDRWEIVGPGSVRAGVFWDYMGAWPCISMVFHLPPVDAATPAPDSPPIPEGMVSAVRVIEAVRDRRDNGGGSASYRQACNHIIEAVLTLACQPTPASHTALTDAIDTLSGIAQPSAGVLSIDQANALGLLIRHASDSHTAPDGLIEQARNMLDARGIGPDTVHGPYVGHEDIVQVVAAALATPADRSEVIKHEIVQEICELPGDCDPGAEDTLILSLSDLEVILDRALNKDTTNG